MKEDTSTLAAALEVLHKRVHRPEFIHPDPLEFIYNYTKIEDREIVAMIAASLAYGRVSQILRSIACVLKILGPSPRNGLHQMSESDLSESLRGFQHRWTTEKEMLEFLAGLKKALADHGSLEACFRRHHRPETGSTLAGLTGFVQEISPNGHSNSLLPSPAKGSACKRLHLFLRWMTRSDSVDPGCWTLVDPAHLVIPLDTHMHRIGRLLGFTRRAHTGIRTAVEITNGFKAFVPHDPVRFDFALTRLGIRPEMDFGAFLIEAGVPRPGPIQNVSSTC